MNAAEARESRGHRERGAIVPIVALVLPVLILATAFAVDLGRQRASRRHMQAVADVIALDMARLADGRTSYDLATDPATETELAAAAARNEVDRARVKALVWGTWTDVDGWDPHHAPGVLPPDDPALVPNAVQVVTTEATAYRFVRGVGTVERSAIATSVWNLPPPGSPPPSTPPTTGPPTTPPPVTPNAMAGVSLGSILLHARTGDAELLNAVITGLLCGTPPPLPVPLPAPQPGVGACPQQAALSAGSYQGLAVADLTLGDLAAAGSFGTVEDLLDSEMTASELARLTARALRNDGDPSTADLYDGGAESLAGVSAAHTATFRFGDLVGVNAPDEGAAAGSRFNAFELFVAGLKASNGENFVDLTHAMPGLALPAGISGIAHTSRYQVIEQPRRGWGVVGAAAVRPPHLRTSQVRMVHHLAVTLDLQVPGVGGVTGTVVLPVDVAGGGAEAWLDGVHCAALPAPTIDVLVAPRPLTGSVGHHDAPVGQLALTLAAVPPLPAVEVGLVDLRVHGEIGGAGQSTDARALRDLEIGESRSTAGSGFALAGSLTTVELGTAVSVGPLEAAIATSLNAALGSLDAALAPAADALGLSLSVAHVRNLGTECDGVRLVA